ADRHGARVDGGAVSFTAAASGASLLEDVRADRRRIGGVAPVEVTAHVGGARLSSGFDGRRVVRVERRGALRSTVRIAGRLADEEGVAGASYRLRLTVTLGSPIVGGDLLVTPLRTEGSATDLALDLPVDVGRGRRARIVGAAGAGRFACGRDGAAVVCRDGQVAVGIAGGARIPVDPALRLGVVVDGRRRLAAGAVQSRLRALAPRAVAATPDGRLRVVLQSGDGRWDAGVPWRSRFAWFLGRSSDAGRHLGALAAEPRSGIRPAPGALAAAVPGRVALGVAPLGVPDDPTPRLLARVDEAILGEWGDLDHGDYRHPWGWANLEYDPAAAFLLRGLASDDARHGAVALAMLDHWVTHDRSRGEGGVPAGLPFQHGREHRSLTWEAGHVWAEGLVLGAIALGDPDHRAAAVALREALVGVVGDRPRFVAEREYAWSLLALADLSLLGPDRAAEAAARELFDRLAARQDPGGWFRIDSAHGEGGAAWSVTPWVTGGITAEAIDRHRRRTGDRRAEVALERIGAFLAGPARLEDGSFARRVLFAPGNAAPIAKSGRSGAVDELLIAAGLGRVAAAGGGSPHRALLEEVLLRAATGLARGRVTPNAAARALVAVRALADARARSGAGP
ncbi:MAG: hypothetical protein ACF8XB_05745, partial [Planctomycetota bacterium JB042]